MPASLNITSRRSVRPPPPRPLPPAGPHVRASCHEPSPATPPLGPAVFHVTSELPWAWDILAVAAVTLLREPSPGHLPARFPVSGCGTTSWLCVYLCVVLSMARHLICTEDVFARCKNARVGGLHCVCDMKPHFPRDRKNICDFNSEENTPGSLGVLGLQLRAESASSNKGLFHSVSQGPFARRRP